MASEPESIQPAVDRTYAELDALYIEAVAYVRHLEADYQQMGAQLMHVETVYSDLAGYTKQLEQALDEHKRAAVESTRYTTQLETELAAQRQANDEGRAYAESLKAHIRRLEVKLHDLEENLRQYRDG